MGARLCIFLAAFLGVTGCHVQPQIVIGGETSSGGTTGGVSVGAGSSTGGSSSGAGTTGTSTGTIIAPIAPSFLLDAGPDAVFGPIAIANGANAIGYSGARLVYALGDGGTFGIFFVSLGSSGAPLEDPDLIATASSGTRWTDAGAQPVASPPRVTVATYGTGTAICWEDYGSADNPIQTWCSGVNRPIAGPIVRCATLDEQGDDPQSSYEACGCQPRLVFNPTDLVTQLVFSDGAWTYGGGWNDSIGAAYYWGDGTIAGGPISSGQDAVLTPGASGPASLPDESGLLLLPVPYTTLGYGVSYPPLAFNLDSTFDVDGGFAATSNFGSQVLSVLELDGAGLRTAAWQFDAGVRPVEPIPYSAPTVGPIAVGTCPKGFGYLAMTDGGQALFAEQSFEGSFLPSSGILFALPGFDTRVTNAVVATQPAGGLFLAVASPAQIAVYFIQGCQ